MLAVNHHTLTQYRQIEVKTMSKPKILTDRNLREVVSHGTARFPFGYYIEDIQQFENGLVSSHWHKEFEFATVRQGQAQISIGTMTARRWNFRQYRCDACLSVPGNNHSAQHSF